MLQHNEQQQLIEKILNQFERDIGSTLLLVEKAINNILLTNGLSEITALQFQVQFINALEEVGYYDKVNDLIDNRFDEIYGTIKKGFAEGGFNITYNQDDLTKITALKQMQLEQFNNLTNETATSIQKSLYKYTLSNASLSDIQEQLREDFKNTNLARYSTTLARTAVADFQQSVIDLKAKDLEGGVWIYVGVSDKKTRDFCQDVLNDKHYYNDAQKTKIQNDPKRRYSCRHRLRFVSLEYALENGYTKA